MIGFIGLKWADEVCKRNKVYVCVWGDGKKGKRSVKDNPNKKSNRKNESI
jgi:hypothetical protein